MATTIATQAALMIGALRAAGATGMTRDELFESAGVANPTACAEWLRDHEEHSIMEDAEKVATGPYSGITTRFTLVVDNAPQQGLFEGEAVEARAIAA